MELLTKMRSTLGSFSLAWPGGCRVAAGGGPSFILLKYSRSSRLMRGWGCVMLLSGGGGALVVGDVVAKKAEEEEEDDDDGEVTHGRGHLEEDRKPLARRTALALRSILGGDACGGGDGWMGGWVGWGGWLVISFGGRAGLFRSCGTHGGGA